MHPTVLRQVIEIAKKAQQRAYAPYSGFRMGAAAYTEKGLLVPGTLVENVSLGLAMCAERVALFTTVAQEAGRPTMVALVAPRTQGRLTFPCGVCLQVALELGGPEVEVVACDPQDQYASARLRDLAPSLPYKGND